MAMIGFAATTRAQPECFLFLFVFVTGYLRIYGSRVYNESECKEPVANEVQPFDEIAKTKLDYESYSKLASNEATAGPRKVDLLEAEGVSRVMALEEKLSEEAHSIKVLFSVLIRTLATMEYTVYSTDKVVNEDGRLEAKICHSVRAKLASTPVGIEDLSLRKARGSTDFNMEKVINEDGQLEVAQRHLAEELRPPDSLSDKTRDIKDVRVQGIEATRTGGVDVAKPPLGYGQKLKDVDKAILADALFLNKILENPEIFGHEIDDFVVDRDTSKADNDAQGPRAGGSTYEHAHSHPYTHSHNQPTCPSDPRKGHYRPTESDMDKLRSTIQLFVRDWSKDGKAERDLCYEPMKKALECYN
ncbi:hypothetical protein M404DRAFT_20346 [Pisolithus tinctorius Marx 270]|uniref:Uncharacterized protein n=1 Tax=Pisolithus tinctorius Marx 270 TaxID=870435 RepID=A0A0C3PST5_PISTI|nr:hypothetical protein M404DRAFT_20346 [Pisolithus tinctorius Marx 270]